MASYPERVNLKILRDFEKDFDAILRKISKF